MLFPETMYKVTFKVPEDKIDDFWEFLIKKKILHIKKEENRLFKEEFYKVKNLLAIAKKYISISQVPPVNAKKENFTLDEIEKYLMGISEKFEKYINLKKEILRKEENLNKLNTFLNIVKTGKEFLNSLKFLTFECANIPVEHFEKIKFLMLNYNILSVYEIKNNNVYTVFISPPKRHNKIFEILKEFSIITINKDLFLLKKEDIAKEKKVLTALEEDIKKEKEKLIKVYSHLKYLYQIYDVKSFLQQKDGFYILEGWIPKSRFEKLPFLISKKTDYTDAPTLLNTPKIFKPFELLVKNYSLPKPYEINPTVAFAIVFLFLFGLMFGDMGQGLILAILGYVLSKKSLFGNILFLSGISSMIFGVIYGHCFGFEIFHTFSPLENINSLIVISIVAGVFIISFGFFIFMFTNYKKNNLKKLIWGENGIVSFMIYMLLIWIGVKTFVFNVSIKIDLAMLFVLAAVFLGHLIYESKKTSESFFEVLIAFLENITNTISFVRAGAFALAHAALFMAIFSIARMLNESGYWIVVFFGNIFIIILEGVVVFIQTLRLEYYEFFKRFYEGGGYEYKPFGS